MMVTYKNAIIHAVDMFGEYAITDERIQDALRMISFIYGVHIKRVQNDYIAAMCILHGEDDA